MAGHATVFLPAHHWTSMIETFTAYLGLTQPGAAILLVLATLLGGLVRGFTGFGFAMVFMPIASMAVGPVVALGLIWAVDAIFAFPIAARSFRRADWHEVVPLMLAATVTLPLGIALLTSLDPHVMRWLLAGVVLTALAILASGWRYHGRAGLPLSLGVGSISGLFNGMASLGGMPLAVFWLGAQRNNARQTRDNLQTYFAVSTIVSGTFLWYKDILTLPVLAQALPLLVPYGLGLLIGMRGFHIASETTFRRIAYLVILTSALVSLPLWDGIFGR
jgi:uncharacterized protein